MHHGDAVRGGLGGRSEARGLASEEELTAVAILHSAHDLHQRGLAGAIFAHQEVNFAGVDYEVAAAEGYYAAEALLDPLELEQQEAIITCSTGPCPVR